MRKSALLSLLFIVTLSVSCSSNEPQPEEPGADMTDNEFSFNDITFAITEATLTPQPDQSVEGSEVTILVLWGTSEDARHELRFDMVINSPGPGLAPGTYPYRKYTLEQPCLRWGSVVVYSEIEPYLTDAELATGELEVYTRDGIYILLFDGMTGKGGLISGKFRGGLE